MAKVEAHMMKYSDCDKKEGLPYNKGTLLWTQPTCNNATSIRLIKYTDILGKCTY